MDSDKKPLAGVDFTLYDKDNKEIGTKTTDKDGIALFEDLKRGTYTVKERKTVNGNTLLSDTFTVEIPKKMSKTEALSKGVDISKARYNTRTDTYDFYDLTYTVTNNATLELPKTGGLPLILIFAGCILLVIGAVYLNKKKK